VPAPAVAARVEPEEEDEIEPAPVAPHVARAQAEAREAAAIKADMEAAIEDDAGRGTGLHLYGVDLNTVTVDEMVARFNGVGRKLAEKILGDRDANGPFKDVYDIARVPGVKGKVFQKITGMAWPTQLFRHREQVTRILGVAGTELPDVRGVAQRFKELDGFLGCIIVHNEDGMILSGTWEHPSAETLGAFAPQMFKKLSRYVKNLKMGTMKTITIFAEDIPFTMVVSGRILFIALHKGPRFSKRQVELVQVLSSELGRRLFA
jgi:competence ComEA-like helix-hairpin-helix protein